MILFFIIFKKLFYISIGFLLAFFIKEKNETLLAILNIKTTLFIILFESLFYFFKTSKIIKNRINNNIRIKFREIYVSNDNQKLKKILRKIYITENKFIEFILLYFIYEFINILFVILIVSSAFLVSKIYLSIYNKHTIITTITVVIIFIIVCFLERKNIENDLIELEDNDIQDFVKKMNLIKNVLDEHQYKNFTDSCLLKFQKETIYEKLTIGEMLEKIDNNKTLKRNFLVFISRYIDFLEKEKNQDFENFKF